jgi:hypothetical protein
MPDRQHPIGHLEEGADTHTARKSLRLLIAVVWVERDIDASCEEHGEKGSRKVRGSPRPDPDSLQGGEIEPAGELLCAGPELAVGRDDVIVADVGSP